MKIATRMLFGVRASSSVSLSITVNGKLPAQPPDLVITTRRQADTMVACNDNTWTVSLGAGDHVVFLPEPEGGSIQDPVVFTFDAPVTIVVPGDTTSASPVTWTAAAGAVSNPKDPWPPPFVDKLDGAALVDATWFNGTLTNLSTQVLLQRSAPDHLPRAKASRRERAG